MPCVFWNAFCRPWSLGSWPSCWTCRGWACLWGRISEAACLSAVMLLYLTCCSVAPRRADVLRLVPRRCCPGAAGGGRQFSGCFPPILTEPPTFSVILSGLLEPPLRFGASGKWPHYLKGSGGAEAGALGGALCLSRMSWGVASLLSVSLNAWWQQSLA